eukprot:CAMPEP_0177261766 /NCGR_PEP_ID=MMETSP0367-20130122/60006_1 /TAXON_ID=447022 ORGANISM="Scrippsiella hangoei-like, Strain SHHI-4" /NCGR_SAMPLE_ID=MMETSP0367 /ASSEMBLY_ACC=CAM_ASM_000362 /LENGTH=41 /DNA_ID= /DNA_START= /DNA_END= /DNA_ORIENTATION=
MPQNYHSVTPGLSNCKSADVAPDVRRARGNCAGGAHEAQPA